MRWLCWILPHRWVDGFDPKQLVCCRCDKIIKKARLVPNGTRACPHLECDGWVAPPPHKEKGEVIVWQDKKCSHCKRRVRWERPINSWGTYEYGEWPDPVAND
jgi:hypothetical protein